MPVDRAFEPRRRRGIVLNGDCIQCRRRRLGLTQHGLADVTGLAVRTVATAEGGQLVSIESAEQICRALGLAWVEALRPGAEEVWERLAAAGYAPGAPPRPWVGREAESARLIEALTAGSEPRVVGVGGPSGIGKTALAQHVAHRLAEGLPDGVVWVAAGALEGDRVARAQVEIADALGFRALLASPAQVTEGGFDQSFQQRLWARSRLLVLDDVRDPDVLAHLAGQAPAARVLVTSARRAVIAALPGETVELGPLAADESMELLRAHLGAARVAAESTEAKALVTSLRGVPRALLDAAHTLVEEQLTRFADYRHRLSAQVPDPEWHRGHLSDEAQRTLRALSAFGPRAFTAARAASVLGLSEAEARRHLSELADSYLLRSASGDPLALSRWLRLAR